VKVKEEFLKKPYCNPMVPLFMCVAAALGTCQDAGLLSRVAKNYGGAVSLSTDFDVAIFWRVREKQEIKHGKIVCAPGDPFRIELGDSRWVCDGTTLWQYDKTVGQVIIRRLSSCDPAQLPSRMLLKYLTMYSFKEKKTKGKNTVFAWTVDSAAVPQKGEARHILFTVDPKNAAVKGLMVVDKSGNESTYTFHATTFGSAARTSAFSFDIPKGARVLDER
jgi:outer membrane lipoprotein-sorting protein